MSLVIHDDTVTSDALDPRPFLGRLAFVVAAQVDEYEALGRILAEDVDVEMHVRHVHFAAHHQVGESRQPGIRVRALGRACWRKGARGFGRG